MSTLEQVLVVVVGIPLLCLFLGLVFALMSAVLVTKPKLRREWEAKVREHGFVKALGRETLQDAAVIGVLIVAYVVWQAVAKACGRAQ
jgi:hypothetical protein